MPPVNDLRAPASEALVDQIGSAFDSALLGDVHRARRLLESQPPAAPRSFMALRPIASGGVCHGGHGKRDASETRALRIFARDGWHCVYCRRPLFDRGALKALYRAAFGDFDRRWPQPHYGVFRTHSAVADHRIPYERGGMTDDANLCAACWQCNDEKNSRTPEEWPYAALAVPRPGWDGRAPARHRLGRVTPVRSPRLTNHTGAASQLSLLM
jgi:hypothetical protein